MVDHSLKRGMGKSEGEKGILECWGTARSGLDFVPQ